MTDPDFSEELRTFIRDCIPDVDAAELLLYLVQTPQRTTPLSELTAHVRSAEVMESTVRKYLASFEHCGLVEQSETGYAFAPKSAHAQAMVHALAKLYNERPVTLVRTIYSLRNERIRAFADAFKLKRP
jgi:hypothetical protein